MTPRRKTAAPSAPTVAPERLHEGYLDRPLTPRSVMASLLLGMSAPRLRGGRLVQWCEAFGITEGSARVALHRMVARGELVADDGTYALAGALRDRQRAQDWSLEPTPEPWDGTWRLAVVRDAARPPRERERLRAAMRALRCAHLRDGVFTRPANLPPEASPAPARATAAAQCMWWDARPDDDPVALARQLFAPKAWAARADDLVGDLDARVDALDTGADGALARAFVAGAAVLTHLRADPLLPAALLPDEWPGEDLRRAYGAFRQRFGEATARWFAARDERP